MKSTPPVSGQENMASRPIIQTIARLIATDRRPTVLANESGEILLANSASQRLKLDRNGIHDSLDWPALCLRASRSGSTPVALSINANTLEGEVVCISLSVGDGYLLRLSENDQEATWLRNRSRAATLMRVAHDLRTPIQSLLASAENLLDDSGPKNESDKTAAHKALLQATDTAMDHISNVLAVIRGEQSLVGINPDETFNITEELRTLLTMIAPIARKQNVDLKLWLTPHEDTWVHGPVRFVRALFQNIIDNSVKYGGAAVNISLTCHPLPPAEGAADCIAITFTVSDLGGGLPEDQKMRLNHALGHPNQRPPTDEMNKSSAGLKVLTHALRQLGGQLDVSDRYDDTSDGDKTKSLKVIGTTMRATITLEKREAQNLSQATPPKDIKPALPLKGRSIILVEDSPSSRDWLRHILETAGAQVWAAGNGIEALSFLETPDISETLDLILTDMTLPYMSGVEFAQRVRQNITPPWTGPIVALTAHVAAPLLAACSEVGISQVLEKPIRPQVLRDTLLNILDDDPSRHKQRSEFSQPQDTAENTLKPNIVEDLFAQLGKTGTLSFMKRAHSEAENVLTNIKQNGVGPDTGRMLHAATGACSLTGLGDLEASLRAMEDAFDRGEDLKTCQLQLEAAITQTLNAITALA
ncbi:hybrid sensor histidine kinase/response regulator [Pacificibacter marinus]|uniref:hybrid sensor histidine kinase/response regulator n=1 Tax=Pacificibacter marinus TaxID=658057 RepID=UPI001C07DA89|nr:response regulator [Pacificibacter marinus]MBU2867312.1 response regulator [Pacificibacter marinus]